MNDRKYICEIDFSITGLLRFISHLELQNFFAKLMLRCNLPVKFSSGFNPHPKISLPVPRPVGIAAYNDRIRVEISGLTDISETDVMGKLQNYAPRGMLFHHIWLTKKSELKRPIGIEWIISLEGTAIDRDNLREKFEQISASNSLLIIRETPKKGRKTIDVGDMIQDIHLQEKSLKLKTALAQTGTIKPTEILRIFGLADKIDLSDIARIKIYWE